MRQSTLFPIPVRLAAILVAIVLVSVSLSSCSSEDAPPEQAEETERVAEVVDAESDEIDEADEADEVLARVNVQVYYPAESGDGLIGEPHEIFMTTAPGDRAKQILADLISGPMTDDALRALPPGTLLRQVYVLDDGTAYVDFSDDLKRGMAGGSTKEIFAVYAIVNSVSLNISEIRRVGILIEGEPVDTLNGHIDLRRPLPPDASLIVGEIAPSVALLHRTGTGSGSARSGFGFGTARPGTGSGSASSILGFGTAHPLNRCRSPCVANERTDSAWASEPVPA